MRVIATAGHVDHGKSALVEALTGTHPDRLKEEKLREMTIDLGFAYFTLPGGEWVGVVDVPGHRDFIENMLAGVGGIDAALLVIAADEGVMPQTREHLAILDLLQISSGVVALNKSDLIDDPAWLELVRGDVERLLAPTGLASAQILPVSARTHAGLDQLRAALERCLAAQPRRADRGRPRLPVDRAFTLSGFGTVVTGTLLDGSFRLGEEVEILPGGKRARVRGLQSHHEKVPEAAPGSRLAMNLTGVEVDEVGRGRVVAHPGDYQATRMLDVRLTLLPDSPMPLEHSAGVKLFLGTDEVLARVRILGGEKIDPGQKGWAQLELAGPLVAARGDQFVLRRPSPGATLGGGTVAEPHPQRRYRRNDKGALARLESLSRGSPASILLQALASLGPAPWKEVVERARLEEGEIAPALAELLGRGELIVLGGNPERDGEALVVARAGYMRLASQLTHTLGEYHAAYPLRGLMPREELRSRLGLSQKGLGGLIARAQEQALVVDAARGLRLPGHEPRFTPEQTRAVEALLAAFARDPYNTPSVKQCQESLGAETYSALLEQERLRQVSGEVVFLRESYEAMVARIRATLQAKGSITVAEARDMFATSRKYVLALLEHLDAAGITMRVGDERKLRAAPK